MYILKAGYIVFRTDEKERKSLAIVLTVGTSML